MVAYLKKTDGSEGFHQIVDFLNSSHIRYALTENPTIYVSLIQQFWNTATAKTLDNREMEITATIDGKVKIVSEASIRRHLKLEESDGIGNFPTTKFFEQLTLMGGAATTVTSLDARQGSGNIDKTPSIPHDSPLPRVHTLGSDEGRMQHNKLMDLVKNLTDRVVALETDLQQTKKVYGSAFTKLIKKVNKLEKTIKTRQDRRKARIVVSDDEEDLEDPSKQGRKIAEIDENPEVYTAEKGVSTTKPVSTASASLEQERLGYEEALRLQAEIDEEEMQRIFRVQEEASSFNIEEWDDIQARVEADEEFA
ncbi:hypothetical protein Tco_0783185 [Tanacetum coccineum]